MDNKFQTRPHRLSAECYQGLITVAFTCCIKGKKNTFTNAEIVLPYPKILFAEASRFECDVLAYVFMPEHHHVLIRGKTEKADIFSPRIAEELNGRKAFTTTFSDRTKT